MSDALYPAILEAYEAVKLKIATKLEKKLNLKIIAKYSMQLMYSLNSKLSFLYN